MSEKWMAKKKYACQAHYINFGIASKKQKYWIIFPKQAFSLYLKKEAVGAVLRQILISDRFAKKVSFISIFFVLYFQGKLVYESIFLQTWSDDLKIAGRNKK